jgi:hypothetical protein
MSILNGRISLSLKLEEIADREVLGLQPPKINAIIGPVARQMNVIVA